MIESKRGYRRCAEPASNAVCHFGELARAGKYGFRPQREMYALPSKKATSVSAREVVGEQLWDSVAHRYEDDAHAIYTDEFVSMHREKASENFDLLMAFFANISADAFSLSMNEAFKKNESLQAVSDLNTVNEVGGVYIMVLDDYRQAYRASVMCAAPHASGTVIAWTRPSAGGRR